MYQIFEITLKAEKIDLEGNISKIRALSWHSNGSTLVKEDDGLQYILDIPSLTLKCVMSELFPVGEGAWLPEDFPSREELVKSVIKELRKLPFGLEIQEIWRIVKHE
ncbi:MAG: hypothetical protein NWE99_07345 [Candidatus Bathyarchaeota archaeon]|nr:hypothetical protein [Candidatus Bathyarchaeota archaeon]